MGYKCVSTIVYSWYFQIVFNSYSFSIKTFVAVNVIYIFWEVDKITLLILVLKTFLSDGKLQSLLGITGMVKPLVLSIHIMNIYCIVNVFQVKCELFYILHILHYCKCGAKIYINDNTRNILQLNKYIKFYLMNYCISVGPYVLHSVFGHCCCSLLWCTSDSVRKYLLHEEQ